MAEVIDASVAIKWFIEERHRDAALNVLDGMIKNPSNFFVPELFYFELTHVLYRVSGTQKTSKHLFERLLDIPINRVPMTAALLERTLYFQSMGLSGYDGAYVALAQLVDGLWLTFDEKAHAKVAHLKLSMCLA